MAKCNPIHKLVFPRAGFNNIYSLRNMLCTTMYLSLSIKLYLKLIILNFVTENESCVWCFGKYIPNELLI